ncbi:Maf family nucleotide pyrophosphatase [Adhaeribacter rhizoryzae]|uniref:dTTP/UTP pyrophosphatase n=1 Tax=Adhaeribacter rhizoryzae TaxID=2607907 RepID=A0A5M6DJX6_9BACT|nr:Maf family nucleotide pyrophosphatase [Adhaeribacter rhizoryzae]KAA5547857.1 septum formation protein Maf [Adhaeribacter rhizoryzae]
MNFNRKLILASNSPRRKELLGKLGLPFAVKVKEVPEEYPAHLQRKEVAEYLANHKAEAYLADLQDEILITADTIVCLDDLVLNKPIDAADAVRMLRHLSGQVHEVITGVCLRSRDKKDLFHDVTRVHFRELLETEIEYYVQTYQPYDKAGAYGAQEWMGMVAIDRIEGSYFNVMGLPVHQVYTHLMQF